MSAINVGGIMNWAKGHGTTALGFAERRGGRMLGRAIRNTEMLNAYGRTTGMRGMAGVVGSASWKAAAIGAGVGVAGSVANDAARGNLDRGSFGRALGGGLMGGAVGGAVGAGNLMFRGNVNRVLAARARSAAAGAAPKAVAASRLAGLRNYAHYSGTGFSTQTPTFARAARGMRSAMSDIGPRLTAAEARMRSVNLGGSGIQMGRTGRALQRGMDKALQWNARSGFVDRGVAGLDKFLRWNALSSAGSMASAAGRGMMRPVDKVLQFNALHQYDRLF